MPAPTFSLPALYLLMHGRACGESPRWPQDRLWVADGGAHEVRAVDLAGHREVLARVPSCPLCLGFLPDGRLRLVSAREGLLLRQEPDGALVPHADLSGLAAHSSMPQQVVAGEPRIARLSA